VSEHDTGDEDDGHLRPFRMRRSLALAAPLVLTPRSWSEERVRALCNHDGGDEDPWQPLSELSRARLVTNLIGRAYTRLTEHNRRWRSVHNR
jgi:hypothetical protein